MYLLLHKTLGYLNGASVIPNSHVRMDFMLVLLIKDVTISKMWNNKWHDIPFVMKFWD
jgi:hypothetical protein